MTMGSPVVLSSPSKNNISVRRTNKPLVEKKRRARINGCLGQLKSLILSAMKTEGAQVSRLEKADILEMTVKYLRHIQCQPQIPTGQASTTTTPTATEPEVVAAKFSAGYSECAAEIIRYMESVTGMTDEIKSRLESHLVGRLHRSTATTAAETVTGTATSTTPPTSLPQHTTAAVATSSLPPSSRIEQNINSNKNSSNIDNSSICAVKKETLASNEATERHYQTALDLANMASNIVEQQQQQHILKQSPLQFENKCIVLHPQNDTLTSPNAHQYSETARNPHQESKTITLSSRIVPETPPNTPPHIKMEFNDDNDGNNNNNNQHQNHESSNGYCNPYQPITMQGVHPNDMKDVSVHGHHSPSSSPSNFSSSEEDNDDNMIIDIESDRDVIMTETTASSSGDIKPALSDIRSSSHYHIQLNHDHHLNHATHTNHLITANDDFRLNQNSHFNIHHDRVSPINLIKRRLPLSSYTTPLHIDIPDTPSPTPTPPHVLPQLLTTETIYPPQQSVKSTTRTNNNTNQNPQYHYNKNCNNNNSNNDNNNNHSSNNDEGPPTILYGVHQSEMLPQAHLQNYHQNAPSRTILKSPPETTVTQNNATSHNHLDNYNHPQQHTHYAETLVIPKSEAITAKTIPDNTNFRTGNTCNLGNNYNTNNTKCHHRIELKPEPLPSDSDPIVPNTTAKWTSPKQTLDNHQTQGHLPMVNPSIDPPLRPSPQHSPSPSSTSSSPQLLTNDHLHPPITLSPSTTSNTTLSAPSLTKKYFNNNDNHMAPPTTATPTPSKYPNPNPNSSPYCTAIIASTTTQKQYQPSIISDSRPLQIPTKRHLAYSSANTDVNENEARRKTPPESPLYKDSSSSMKKGQLLIDMRNNSRCRDSVQSDIGNITTINHKITDFNENRIHHTPTSEVNNNKRNTNNTPRDSCDFNRCQSSKIYEEQMIRNKQHHYALLLQQQQQQQQQRQQQHQQQQQQQFYNRYGAQINERIAHDQRNYHHQHSERQLQEASYNHQNHPSLDRLPVPHPSSSIPSSSSSSYPSYNNTHHRYAAHPQSHGMRSEYQETISNSNNDSGMSGHCGFMNENRIEKCGQYNNNKTRAVQGTDQVLETRQNHSALLSPTLKSVVRGQGSQVTAHTTSRPFPQCTGDACREDGESYLVTSQGHNINAKGHNQENTGHSVLPIDNKYNFFQVHGQNIMISSGGDDPLWRPW